MNTTQASHQQASRLQAVHSSEEPTTICINDQEWRCRSTSSRLGQCVICNDDVISKHVCVGGHGSCQKCFQELSLVTRETNNCFLCRKKIAPASKRVEGDLQLSADIASADFFCTEKHCQWQGKYHQLTAHHQQHVIKDGNICLPLPETLQPSDSSEPTCTLGRIPEFAERYALICNRTIFGYMTVLPDRDARHKVLSNIWEVSFIRKPDTRPKPEAQIQTLMDKAHLWLEQGTPTYSVRGDERNLLMTSESGLVEMTYQDQNRFLDLDLLPSSDDLSERGDNGSPKSLPIGFVKPQDGEPSGRQGESIDICHHISLSKRRRTEKYEFQRYSTPSLSMIADAHNNPTMSLYLLMGANHERLLGQVCKTGEDSQSFCYASGIDAWDGGMPVYTMGGNYLTPQKDKHGLATAVIQKDPPDDPHPCGYEIHFKLDADHQRWQSIRFIKPGNDDMVMEAQPPAEDTIT